MLPADTHISTAAPTTEHQVTAQEKAKGSAAATHWALKDQSSLVSSLPKQLPKDFPFFHLFCLYPVWGSFQFLTDNRYPVSTIDAHAGPFFWKFFFPTSSNLFPNLNSNPYSALHSYELLRKLSWLTPFAHASVGAKPK